MSNENISQRLSKNFSRIYYSTEGYWKGYSAINKLAEKSESK